MNVEWLSSLPGPARAAIYFGLQRGIGSKVFSAWRQLQKWQKLTPSELGLWTERALDQVLTAAIGDCDYYRELGLRRVKGEDAGDFLRRFPVLSKNKVRQNFTRLVSDALRGEIRSMESVPPGRYNWVIVKTGGSTGTPTTVVHDAGCRDWGRASRLFSQALCGFPLGQRYFRLWGSEQDLFQQEEKLDRRVLRALLGEVPMNAFRSRESELMKHYQALQSHPRIEHLMAYVDAAVMLGRFIQEKNLPRRGLRTIMACAGTVTPEWRAFLEHAFKGEVFDKYGSRECSDMACECRCHTGLHVYSSNVFLEIVDEQGEPCPPGRSGRILVTMLRNRGFPMIRYEIGDLGSWAEPGECPCGLAFPRLSGLQGRQDDMLLTEEGAWVSPLFVRHFVGVSLNRQCIGEWQLEQSGLGMFVFRFVPLGEDGLKENLEGLSEALKKNLGQSARIEMRQVDEIVPARSGKTLWVINSMSREKAARLPEG